MGIGTGLEKVVSEEGRKKLQEGAQWFGPADCEASQAPAHRLRKFTRRAVRHSYATAGAAVGEAHAWCCACK